MTLWPYPTTACGESRLIWKSQAASRTPNEVLDFWESAELRKIDLKPCKLSNQIAEGHKSWTTNRLPPRGEQEAIGSSRKPEDSSHKLEKLPPEEFPQLKAIAAPSFRGGRLQPDASRQIILQLCEDRFLTATDLSELMSRNPNSLRSRLLSPLVEEGLLVRKYPEEPNRPDQAYTRKS